MLHRVAAQFADLAEAQVVEAGSSRHVVVVTAQLVLDQHPSVARVELQALAQMRTSLADLLGLCQPNPLGTATRCGSGRLTNARAFQGARRAEVAAPGGRRTRQRYCPGGRRGRASGEPGRRTVPGCGCGSTGANSTNSSRWSTCAARTSNCTREFSRCSVSLRPPLRSCWACSTGSCRDLRRGTAPPTLASGPCVRTELSASLVRAGLSSGNGHDLAPASAERVLRIVGRGNQPALSALAPRTARAIDAAIDASAPADNFPSDWTAAVRIGTPPGGSCVDEHMRAEIEKPVSLYFLQHTLPSRRSRRRVQSAHRPKLRTVGRSTPDPPVPTAPATHWSAAPPISPGEPSLNASSPPPQARISPKRDGIPPGPWKEVVVGSAARAHTQGEVAFHARTVETSGKGPTGGPRRRRPRHETETTMRWSDP